MIAVAEIALLLNAVYLALTFGVRGFLQWRRTGDAGFRLRAFSASAAERVGGLLFALSLALVLAAPVLDLTGVLPAFAPLQLPALAVLLAVLGIAGTLHAQLSMGDSWRVGVDASESTALRTSGPFRYVRNPIFSWMILTAAALALLVPNLASFAGLAALVVGIELQVRLVEEPYLLRTHGDAYARWASATGRFVPGIGRLPGVEVSA